ncbi:zf-HC2 domain-containing protein [Nocardioides sp.]|uniref:zf-HC2 domain-containing protein n=1 Tax=Nocardioides sp. TaxID=35761 RepID=UPI0035285E9A
MSCPMSHLDGAYVLGALSSAERLEFERHLAGCAACADAVRELAGLSGLLAKVEADVWDGSDQQERMPEGSLAAITHDLRRRRGRRWVAGVAAAAALVTGGAVAGASFASREQPPPTTGSRVAADPLRPESGVRMRAEVALTSVGWGTKVELTCHYDDDDETWHDTPPVYHLVLETPDGPQQVATWKEVAAPTMQLSAATAVTADDITEVMVTDDSGALLLHLDR